MDIKEKQAIWLKEKPLFEAELIHSHLLPFFTFNENTGDYEIKVESLPNTDDEDRKVAYESLNTGWAMWLRAKNDAKAQAVPEGFVLVPKEPTLEMCHRGRNTRSFKVQDIYKAMIEAQEPAPLKLGDLVEPIDHRYTLASGCERYPYAYVVNTNPFQLMSEEGDMYWRCTVEAGGYKLIKSNDQLPEAVSLRMIREGLLSPVETREQKG